MAERKKKKTKVFSSADLLDWSPLTKLSRMEISVVAITQMLHDPQLQITKTVKLYKGQVFFSGFDLHEENSLFYFLSYLFLHLILLLNLCLIARKRNPEGQGA